MNQYKLLTSKRSYWERTSSKLLHHHLLAYVAYLSKRKDFSLVIPLSFVSHILDSFDLNWFRVLDKDIG